MVFIIIICKLRAAEGSFVWVMRYLIMVAFKCTCVSLNCASSIIASPIFVLEVKGHPVAWLCYIVFLFMAKD